MINLRQLIARLMNGEKRNLWTAFGYPTVVKPEDFMVRYQRDGIAQRIIRAFPDACWTGRPIIQDEQGSSPKPDQKDFSAFTQAWEDLEDRTKALAFLNRVDRLSRIGHYALLVLGFEGEEDLDQPVQGQRRLMYLSAYAETSITIQQWETDPKDPRFGQPKIYQVQPPTEQGPLKAFRIHHTRVIHVAEGCDESDVFGEPALRSIWNDLLDLEKVTGSGAETFWLNARGGLSVTADANARLTEASRENMRQQVEDYENQLRRVLAIQGASVNAIQTQVSDPKPNFEIIIQKIGGAKGVPQRLLLGNEQGQLASSEDANSWEGKIKTRRELHCGPNIFEPFITRMIETGNLPQPQGNWLIEWPPSAGLSEERQAAVALQKIQAASTWGSSFADRAVALEEVRVWLGLPPNSEYALEEDIQDDVNEDDVDVIDPDKEDDDAETTDSP